MQVVRWNPFRDMSYIENQMKRFLEGTLDSGPAEPAGANGWFPVADIYESDNDLVVKTELPGVDPKAVDVRVENNVLTIRGERQFEEKFKKEDYHRIERHYGPFSRAFTLPASINPERIRAQFKNGVLSITLPKAEEAKAKKIEVAAA